MTESSESNEYVEPEFCPIHGDSGNPLMGWPCPVAVEGDPEDEETCSHFEKMLLGRQAEVQAGNYYELSEPDESGHSWFKGHGVYEGDISDAPFPSLGYITLDEGNDEVSD